MAEEVTMLQTRAFVRISVALVVSAWTGIASGQDASQVDRLTRMRAGPPKTYGTTRESFYSIGEWEFDPINTSQTYADPLIPDLIAQRFSTGGNRGFLGSPHLPDGALLTSVTFDLCDSNTTDQHWTAALLSCRSVDGLCLILGDNVESISNVVEPCAAYTQDLSGLNHTVNNQTRRLLLYAGPGTGDETNALAGAVVGYKLQVSDPPATATFGDVPENHPFFQFIEALARSGITVGCGGGKYCPDSPLTRGQMAVFLAKALGLQFP